MRVIISYGPKDSRNADVRLRIPAAVERVKAALYSGAAVITVSKGPRNEQLVFAYAAGKIDLATGAFSEIDTAPLKRDLSP